MRGIFCYFVADLKSDEVALVHGDAASWCVVVLVQAGAWLSMVQRKEVTEQTGTHGTQVFLIV
jgi:hypothetical protein